MAGNKEVESDNTKSGAQSYEFENITNVEDWPIHEELDVADNQIPIVSRNYNKFYIYQCLFQVLHYFFFFSINNI